MYCSTCLSPLFIGSGGKKGEKVVFRGGWKSFGIFVAQLGQVGRFWPWRRLPNGNTVDRLAAEQRSST